MISTVAENTLAVFFSRIMSNKEIKVQNWGGGGNDTPSQSPNARKTKTKTKQIYVLAIHRELKVNFF